MKSQKELYEYHLKNNPDKMEVFRESAKEIVKQYGRCIDIACSECPLFDEAISCSGLANKYNSKKKFLTEYLKEYNMLEVGKRYEFSDSKYFINARQGELLLDLSNRDDVVDDFKYIMLKGNGNWTCYEYARPINTEYEEAKKKVKEARELLEQAEKDLEKARK